MSSIKKNYFYNLIYQLLLIILPLITAPYVSRTVGAEGLGIYSFSYSIAQYFALFILLGVNNYGNRTIAAIRNNKEKKEITFWEIYKLQFSLGILVVSIFLIYLTIFVKENINIFLMQIIYLISVVLDINWYFFGNEEFKITVTRNTIVKILTVIATFIFVKSKDDLNVYAFLLCISYLISQLILWFFLLKKIKYHKTKIKDSIKHLKENLLLFIPVIATSIYVLTDKVMLGFICTMKDVGYYEYAEKLRNIPMGFISALGTVMLPTITNMIAIGKKNETVEYTRKSMIFSMFCAFALTFGLSGIANEFIPIFYGSGFYESIILLQILSLSIIFASWANVIRTQILIPYKKDKIYVISTVLGALVNIILNYYLIIKYNAVGAVIATVISEFVVAFYQTIKIKNELNVKKIIKYIIQFLITGIVMFRIVRFIGENLGTHILTIIIEVSVGTLVYVVSNILLLIITKDFIIKDIIDMFNYKKKVSN